MVGGVDDDDDDAEILPRPSRKAALEAAATLERYVSVPVTSILKICTPNLVVT